MSAAGGSVVVPPRGGPAVTTPWGEVVTQKVSSELTGGAFSAGELEVPANEAGQRYVQHQHDECFYVAEGQFEFGLDDDVVSAPPGALVYVPRGAARSYRNLGDHQGRLLVLQTPGGLLERLREDIEELDIGEKSPAESGSARLTADAASYGMELL